MKLFFTIFFTILLLISGSLTQHKQCFAQDGFTQKDREMLIELKVKTDEIDKRFEQIDKRFEQVDKRFEDQFNFLLILSSIFTVIMVAAIGFAFWDRATSIDTSVKKAFDKTEKEGSYLKLLNAMRELAKTNPDVERVLRQFNLL